MTRFGHHPAYPNLTKKRNVESGSGHFLITANCLFTQFIVNLTDGILSSSVIRKTLTEKTKCLFYLGSSFSQNLNSLLFLLNDGPIS